MQFSEEIIRSDVILLSRWPKPLEHFGDDREVENASHRNKQGVGTSKKMPFGATFILGTGSASISKV